MWCYGHVLWICLKIPKMWSYVHTRGIVSAADILFTPSVQRVLAERSETAAADLVPWMRDTVHEQGLESPARAGERRHRARRTAADHEHIHRIGQRLHRVDRWKRRHADALPGRSHQSRQRTGSITSTTAS